MTGIEEWDASATDEEREAASRMASALDGAGDREGVESELEVATLFRASNSDDDRWSEARAARVWARVVGADAGAVARRRRRWRFGAVGAAAAAAVVAVFSIGVRGGGTTRLPAPGIALLKVQAESAATGKSIARLRDEMRAYRAQMFVALAKRYGETR
jgi:hypothetical protein